MTSSEPQAIMSEYKPVDLSVVRLVIDSADSDAYLGTIELFRRCLDEIKHLRARVAELENPEEPNWLADNIARVRAAELDPPDREARIDRVLNAISDFLSSEEAETTDGIWIEHRAIAYNRPKNKRDLPDSRKAFADFARHVLFGDGVLPDPEGEQSE